MHLDLMRDKSRVMPAIENVAAITSLRIWYCSYKTITPVSGFENIEELEIAGFPDASLETLSKLKRLKKLRVIHLPRVTDLAPLSSLRELNSLSLETLPSWDSSGKKSLVASLEPVANIPLLQHISLLGVVPNDRSLTPIEQCKNLKSAKFHGYPKVEVARFFAATRISNEHNP